MITREDVKARLSGMPERINSVELREKTMDAFMLAIGEGGWRSMEELEEMPFTLLTDARCINFWEHTMAVTMGAIGLAMGQIDSYTKMPYRIDMDRLIAGGLLHDVGKLVEFERAPNGNYTQSHSGKCTRHPISGTVIAAKADLPLEIQNIITCHAREGEGRPQVIEAVLIHQADFATFNPLVMMVKGQLIIP